MFVGSKYSANLSRKDIAAKVKQQLHKEFPNSKWGVTSDDYSIKITLMRHDSEIRNIDIGEFQINGPILQHNRLNSLGRELFTKAYEIASLYRYDNSDVLRGNTDINFDIHLSVGKWNNHFVVKR